MFFGCVQHTLTTKHPAHDTPTQKQTQLIKHSTLNVRMTTRLRGSRCVIRYICIGIPGSALETLEASQMISSPISRTHKRLPSSSRLHEMGHAHAHTRTEIYKVEQQLRHQIRQPIQKNNPKSHCTCYQLHLKYRNVARWQT